MRKRRSLRQRFALPPPSQREALKGRLTEGGLMPRRCRGIRGDEGIAPYGRATRVQTYNVSPSVSASRCHLPHRGRQGDGGTDSHASDIGRWLGMTRQEGRLWSSAPAGAAGRCTPRELVPLRSTAWASLPTRGARGAGVQRLSLRQRFALPPQLRFATHNPV